jgi:hypothetical protein
MQTEIQLWKKKYEKEMQKLVELKALNECNANKNDTSFKQN